MREAERLGYNPWDYHESVLCPGEFPEPVSRDDATLAKILGVNGHPVDVTTPTQPDEVPAGNHNES